MITEIAVLVVLVTSSSCNVEKKPEGVAEKFKSAIAEQRFKDIGPLLSRTGKKRVHRLAYFLPNNEMKSGLATALDLSADDVRDWTVIDWLDATATHRSKLSTKGIDLGSDWDPENFRTVVAQVSVDEPAIDGDRATVPFSNAKGRAFFLDMEREGGVWRISYFREPGDEPLWDPEAELKFVRMEKRTHATEADSNLKDLQRGALGYGAQHKKAPTSFDLLDQSFRPGRYTYFLAENGTGGSSVRDDDLGRLLGSGSLVRPVKDAVILPPDLNRNPGAATFSNFGATRCGLSLTAADGSTLSLGAQGKIWVMAAAANLDDDEDADCWSISNVNRISRTGQSVVANEPYHEHAD